MDAPSGHYQLVLMDVQTLVMDGHLTKPVEIDKLFEALDEVLG